MMNMSSSPLTLSSLDCSVCSGVIIVCQLAFGSRSGEITIVEKSDPAANLPLFEDWLKRCCPHFCPLYIRCIRTRFVDPCERLECEDEIVRHIRETVLLDKRVSCQLSDYSHLFEGGEREPVEPTPVVHPASMEYKDIDVIVDVDCLCEVPDLPPQHPSEVSTSSPSCVAAFHQCPGRRLSNTREPA